MGVSVVVPWFRNTQFHDNYRLFYVIMNNISLHIKYLLIVKRCQVLYAVNIVL